MPMKVRDVVRRLEAAGYVLVRQQGSHRRYQHPETRAVTTIAGKNSDTMKAGTLASIRRATGLEDLR